ncbi:MAG: 3-deoxy-D-manno-octulosonic acid transferase [Candidatus Omnitrophota bacterium]
MLRTFLYNLAFAIFGALYFPIFLTKLRQAEDPDVLWKERRGIFPKDWAEKFSGKKIVWLHAVSVGEVMAVEKFIREWLASATGYELLLTTVTPTGQRIAKKLAGERVHVCYFPFDLTQVVKRFLDLFRPVCLLLMETEIWPNLLTEAKRRNIPVGIINARLSERSFKRYKTFPWLFKPLWEKLDFVLAQSEEDAARFRKLGVTKESVRDMGNMKFDQAEWAAESAVDTAGLRQAWGYASEDLVWIAGSTHPGEEEMLTAAFRALRERFPTLKLILAPRHIERSESLLKQLEKYGFSMVLSTSPILHQKKERLIRLAPTTVHENKIEVGARGKEGPGPDLQILDQLGVLKNLYGIADLVFMGGSLVPHGGQNPIEPAHFSKTILHGPHVFNFHKIYHQLDHEGGALRISAPDELSSAAAEILANESSRHEIGQKAFQIVNRLRGASKRQAGWILTFLRSRRPQERITSNGQHEELLSSLGGGQTK